MHISKVDLNLFAVFDAIDSEGSVSAAARKLNLSQPAVSHALARLRTLLKDPLFERQGQRMVSTAVARSLIEPVRASLRGLELVLGGRADFDAANSTRRFTLALRDVMESATLPALMRQLARVAPQVSVAASRVARRDLVAQFASGTVDAAIDILLPFPASVRHAQLAHENTVVLARAGHPMLAGGAPITLERYLAQGHVLVSSRREGPGIEDFELSRLGLARRVTLRCQHYFAACKVVSETDLLLTLPERFARISDVQFANVMLPLPFAMPPWDLYLYWHESVERDPANSWLREQVGAAFLAPDAPP
ncbi:MAG: LysR family transcriptional regulator [Pseudomonadota bacterium]